MAEYFVYDNGAKGYSKVHRASCRHCNQGRGKTNSEVGPRDLWVPASSLRDAEKKAQALHRAAWTRCGVCKP